MYLWLTPSFRSLRQHFLSLPSEGPLFDFQSNLNTISLKLLIFWKFPLSLEFLSVPAVLQNVKIRIFHSTTTFRGYFFLKMYSFYPYIVRLVPATFISSIWNICSPIILLTLLIKKNRTI